MCHRVLWFSQTINDELLNTVMDPATYYGHSEAEFGMSWCAGFSDAFYTGVQALHQFHRCWYGFSTDVATAVVPCSIF